MKIRIKSKIRIKVKSAPTVSQEVIPVDIKPVIPSWREMSNDQRIKTYFKFDFMVCWECGRRTDDARLLGKVINEEILGVFICKACQFWKKIKEEEIKQMGVKVKVKKSKEGKEKTEKESGGSKLNGHSKGQSGLNVKDTWCLGLVKGHRKSKLSAFMVKEFPDAKVNFEKEVEKRTAHFEAGKWDSRKKKLPKALLK